MRCLWVWDVGKTRLELEVHYPIIVKDGPRAASPASAPLVEAALISKRYRIRYMLLRDDGFPSTIQQTTFLPL